MAQIYSSYDVGENIFVPYLKNEGVFRIELAIITHFHKDHCQGILAAMKELKVKTVAFPDFMPTNKYRTEAEAIAKEKGIEIVYLEKGDRIKFASGAVIDVIAPTPYEKSEENDTSIVFNLNTNGFNALFCGDATVNVEKENSESFSDVDLIKVPHHGSATSSSLEFVNTITPEYAVISVGEDNRYNLPDEEIVQRYKDAGAEVLKTSELEDIKFKIRKNGAVSYK